MTYFCHVFRRFEGLNPNTLCILVLTRPPAGQQQLRGVLAGGDAAQRFAGVGAGCHQIQQDFQVFA